MSKPKIAHTKICDTQACAIRDLLVRGDKLSFVSVEQAEKTGIHPLDDQKMPSDIVLPGEFVVVQDPTGKYLRKCDFYVVQWHSGTRNGIKTTSKVAQVAQAYFGEGARPEHGSVDIPEGPWHREAKIAFIRYRRAGDLRGNYEHPYNPAVQLWACDKPLAWRVALPTGCVVDARGFVWP